jgi:hypothetical protein
MRWAAAILVLALAVQIVGVARAEPDEPPPATKEYASADKRFTMSLPAAWTVDRDPIGQSVMAWSVKLPDGAGQVALEVYSVPGILNARAQPYIERDVHPGRFGIPGPAHVESEPTPHLWLDEPVKSGGVDRHVWIYRVIRRNGLTLHVICDGKVWDSIRPDCMRAAQSLATTLPEWPPVPETYRRLTRDGYAEYLHPSVKDADADALHKLLRAEEAEFAKRYGPLWKPPESPFVVVIHKAREDAAPMDQYASTAKYGSFASGAKHQLFVVPPAKGDVAANAELVGEAWQAFLVQSFGGAIPYWLYLGESSAARVETTTGRSLPSVPDGLYISMTKTLRPFDEIARLENVDGSAADEMFMYVAFFRCGPKSYRDAFAAFLKDLAATGDCETAQRTHLLSLDQTKLRAAAQSFVAKELKPVKPR